MARTGMAGLIADLRGMTEGGTAVYSVGGVTYFSDDQMQKYLDKTARRRTVLEVRPLVQYVGGSAHYYDYEIPLGQGVALEEATGGTAVWQLRDSVGSAVGTASYSINYQQRLISFAATTGGSAYYLDCVTYSPAQAAAEVWRWKAAHVASAVDWESDNHKVTASQKMAQCLEMARFYMMQGGAQTGRIINSDVRY